MSLHVPANRHRHASPDRRAPVGPHETDGVLDQHHAGRWSKKLRWSMPSCNVVSAGAGLDVFEQESLFHPSLRELRQVVLLPHPGFSHASDEGPDGYDLSGKYCGGLCRQTGPGNQVNQIAQETEGTSPPDPQDYCIAPGSMPG